MVKIEDQIEGYIKIYIEDNNDEGIEEQRNRTEIQTANRTEGQRDRQRIKINKRPKGTI